MTNSKYPAFAFVAVLLTVFAHAQTFTTLYNFTPGADGNGPIAALIQDSAGSLYGTTEEGGGSAGYGVVFELNTSGVETVLHSFTGPTSDGAIPVAPLIRDSAGNLYGTTAEGGSGEYDFESGAVFKIDSAGNETILYSFLGPYGDNGDDGCYPYQGLVMDKASNFYGTTRYCGADRYGTVFKLTPQGTESIVYSFTGGYGRYPTYGRLLRDGKGNLYGVTSSGDGVGCGYDGCGVLYELTSKGTFRVLHFFAGKTADGCYPFGTVAMDKAGNVYGTTEGCGASGYGTIWKVSKKGVATILHSFTGGPNDGAYPLSGVVLDASGNMYGTTVEGGASEVGTVYELSNSGTMTLLHSFAGSDGGNPFGEVLRDANGALYGTTNLGGTGGAGTIWTYQ